MEQEFPSFLMESYVQEKLLICTWKHTGFAFCFSTNTVLVYIRKIWGTNGEFQGFITRAVGPQPAKVIPTLSNAALCGFLSRFAHFHPIFRCSRLARIHTPRVLLAQAPLPAGFWGEQDFGRSRILGGEWLCPVPQPGSSWISLPRAARNWDLGTWPSSGAGPGLWEFWCLIC